MEDITSKEDLIEIESETGVALKTESSKIDDGSEKVNPVEGPGNEDERKGKGVLEKEPVTEVKKDEQVAVEIEPKTGVSFPVKLEDGKPLKAAGVRKKSMLGIGIKIYAFGIYADNEKMKDLVTLKIGKAPPKPTKEIYQMVIDSDIAMTVRLVVVFSSLTINLVKKNFDEGIGGAIKKLTGNKHEELSKRIMGEASDDIKLTPGSVIEISKLPGFVLQTKVKGQTISTIESELLCRAFIYMYLGDDPFDKEAKENFGASLLSLFSSTISGCSIFGRTKT